MNRNASSILGILLFVSLGCDRESEPKIANIPSAQQSTERVAVDRLNREVRFNVTPQRIISLMPAATELMYAIGAGSQLVGVTKNCNYPPEAETLERVGGGTMESISREKIVSLKPDLVLCKWDHHQPLMETLSQFNIPALAIGPETLEQLFAEATMLGNVTGHADEAKRLISEMRLRLAGIEARVSSIPLSQRRNVFYEVWDDPLMTAGPGSFIGEAIRLAGMKNIFADATANYPKVSDEVVVSRNPDVIFSPSTHASRVSLEKMLQRQGWGEVAAIKQKQVFIVNGDHISRCGPRLLDAIEEMISLAYPNAGVQPFGARLNNLNISAFFVLDRYAIESSTSTISLSTSTSHENTLNRTFALGVFVGVPPLGGPYKLANQLKPAHQRMTGTHP